MPRALASTSQRRAAQAAPVRSSPVFLPVQPVVQQRVCAAGLKWDPLRLNKARKAAIAQSSSNGGGSAAREEALSTSTSSINPAGEFCIIESREAVKDFAKLQLGELGEAISARRNKIFLMMEEVRRLRIQQRLKGGEAHPSVELAEEKYVSALPFLPPLSEKNLNTYYTFYACFVATVILFGGLLAPILELKLGLGGVSYLEFVQSMHLPSQLAQVDPIVASFCGGSVGVLSALLVVEVNNVKAQQRNRCHYCDGTGYLTCGSCVGSGRSINPEGSQGVVASSLRPATASGPQPCSCCSGTGKVMCTGCLCTGKQMATEHDPRIDPFNA